MALDVKGIRTRPTSTEERNALSVKREKERLVKDRSSEKKTINCAIGLISDVTIEVRGKLEEEFGAGWNI
ncbi:hypothetical protein NPIL_283891 [Nephila pilipes]|uniref:Uncharacterized protein n=1 Tax=Nephila pilipes TaxID=299642 RepID=A0A8X6ISM4_NEPPI|nr:hypothetical protein NPIL_283891 [Nephila pilipes]